MFFMRTGPAARQPWILVGALRQRDHLRRIRLLECRYGVPPDAVLSGTPAYFGVVGVSWLVIVGQSMWMRAAGGSDNS